MVPFDPVNLALEYIENRLGEPISSKQIAQFTGYSRAHFDRCFSAIIGESPAAYLRKRRLSEAARQLIASEKSILSIALDFQYQSAEAFTRAFSQEFHLTPSAYRRRKRLARFFSRMRVNRKLELWLPPRYNQLLYPSPSRLLIK